MHLGNWPHSVTQVGLGINRVINTDTETPITDTSGSSQVRLPSIFQMYRFNSKVAQGVPRTIGYLQWTVQTGIDSWSLIQEAWAPHAEVLSMWGGTYGNGSKTPREHRHVQSRTCVPLLPHHTQQWRGKTGGLLGCLLGPAASFSSSSSLEKDPKGQIITIVPSLFSFVTF